MHYLYSHIAAAGGLLGLLTAFIGFIELRRRKTGKHVGRGARGALIIATIVVAILFGLALGHT